MHRFWESYTGPLIETLQPRRLLEIGAEFGWNTQHALEFCRRTGAHMDVIDAVPLPSLHETLARYADVDVTLHAAKSLDVLGQLAPFDFVLLDGDHNWRTVYNELSLLFGASDRAGVAPPVVVAHDCAWPYARRDMYYDPEAWREIERQPYAYRGMRPGEPGLVDDGLNTRFANALIEGGPQNGVLTALEDFVASRGGVSLHVLPFHNGLGILAPDGRRTPDLDALIARFFGSQMLLERCRVLEEDGMRVRIELAGHERLLTQRTEALVRARQMLEQRGARIGELERRLAELQPAPGSGSDGGGEHPAAAT